MYDMTPLIKYFLHTHIKCKTQHTATTLNHSDGEQSSSLGLSGTLRTWWILGQEETASSGTSSLSQGLQLSVANTHTPAHIPEYMFN